MHLERVETARSLLCDTEEREASRLSPINQTVRKECVDCYLDQQ